MLKGVTKKLNLANPKDGKLEKNDVWSAGATDGGGGGLLIAGCGDLAG